MTQALRVPADPIRRIAGDGAAIDEASGRVVLRSPHGLVAEVDARGGSLGALWLPDRAGRRVNVVLGHADPVAPAAGRDFFGASVGRVAGRIAGARFPLDGREYTLPANDGTACLHGGSDGFDMRVWQWRQVEAHRAVLRLVSDDGDQGFPGALTVDVEYRFDPTGALHVLYTARCDRPTVVNLTHHPFWNLAGEGERSIDDHMLTLPASSFVALDAALLPTGETRRVDGSVFDFRAGRTLGAALHDIDDAQLQLAGGYDHYWVLDQAVDGTVRPAARLHHPASGRVLDVLSDQPGLQVYSGNFLDGRVSGPSGRPYGRHAGVCLEPQALPGAVHDEASSPIRLLPGQCYRNHVVYRFLREPPADTE